MDLLVPCIVEGRSELRNYQSCELQDTLATLSWLRNTLLTERIYRLAEHSYLLYDSSLYVDCSALGWECFHICVYFIRISHIYILSLRCHEKYFTAIFSRNSVLRLDDRKASTHIRRISLDCWYSHIHTHCDTFMPTHTSSHTQTVIPWLTAMRYRMQTRNIIIPHMYISHTLHTRHISSSEDTR
jgi:hypothetical protein